MGREDKDEKEEELKKKSSEVEEEDPEDENLYNPDPLDIDSPFNTSSPGSD